ncbi:DUF3703 domain-containing protein [Pseudocolwellia sp. HL-MZ19]|uniref:DUF3703 domain-containing protein n=1 Tax=unclassified Pseudocolwellia TaxID=2848178 RepID=UPI003CF9A39C
MFNRFTKNIKPYVEEELDLARKANLNGHSVQAFKHLENAHVLGQESTYFHVKVHLLMLHWAIKEHDLPELLGQFFRVVGAASKTAVGFIPSGNTGGSNVSPFKVMPISTKHEDYIARAKSGI